jgi:hypothetical protein
MPVDNLGEETGSPLSPADREWQANLRATEQARIATIAAYEAAQAHRRQREVAYIRRLSKEEPHATSFQRTVGDMFDAIFKQVEANRIAAGASRVPEFDDAITRIAQVKAEFPAPSAN